jgi:hypothetical protein
MYQPNKDPFDPYLTCTDVRLLVERLAPRKLGKSQFYLWLELLEEAASEPYSNWVAAQMIKFGELLNRPLRQGGTLDEAKRDLRRYLDQFESEQLFIEEVFHEAQKHCQPQLVWVLPVQKQTTNQTIEVVGQPA